MKNLKKKLYERVFNKIIWQTHTQVNTEIWWKVHKRIYRTVDILCLSRIQEKLDEKS